MIIKARALCPISHALNTKPNALALTASDMKPKADDFIT
jgi:hypothetical protein